MVSKASGTWRVTRLSHSIAAFSPGGAWQSEIEAVPAEEESAP